MTEVIAARGVFKAYREGGLAVEVLKGADLDLAAGEIVAVVGASGSGKSTLLHCLGGLDELDAGTVQVSGRDLAKLSEEQREQLLTIRSFLEKAKDALGERDLAKASNLADKARILAEELAQGVR